MDVGPVLVICPDLDERKVEGAVFFSDLPKLRGHARIAAMIDPSRFRDEDPRAPERIVAVEEPAPGKMARRYGDYGHAVHVMLVPPGILDDLLSRDAPAFQNDAHALGDME